MSQANSTPTANVNKPSKPTEDFPLFPHATKRWAKKVKGQMLYFGPWDDPAGALKRYKDYLKGKPMKKRAKPIGRPAKPTPDFPLFAHATKRWAKKIRGQLHYFGPWDQPDAALEKYNAEKEALHAGKKPRPDQQSVTVRDAANAFLTHKENLRDTGEIKPRTWQEYEKVARIVDSHFGKGRLVEDIGPDDFAPLRQKLAKNCGPVRLGNTIQVVRSIFKHAFDADLIPTPIRFGPGFARPSKKVLRLERTKKGIQMFEAEEIRQMLAAAGPAMKAMILLAVNCGFGNADVGTIPLTAVDLERGWVNYPRPKTGIDRKCKLWPETVQAVRAWLAKHPEVEGETAGLLFITKYRKSWHKDIPGNPLSAETRKLLDTLGINGHRNFYCLRHTFETIGDAARDQIATNHIMGHADSSMAATYRERIDDARLEAVAAHVRQWLFPKVKATKKTRPAVLPFKAAQ